MDFDRSFASHPKAEFWDYSKNEKTPEEVFKSSNKKFWFICGDCEHSFDTTLASVSNGGHWCPFCTNQKLCERDCTTCFEKSFASHPKVKFWDYSKNNKPPHQLSISSGKKCWFVCNECSHSFDVQLNIAKNRWCPFCAIPSRKLCDEDCVQCFEKSFANHPKAEFWDYSKNNKSPRKVFRGSDKRFWFNCDECGHSFDTSPNCISCGENWCPFCTNRKLCEEDCTRCFEKSFASSHRAKFWDYSKNEKKPRQVFKSSGTKFWFDCGDNHSFGTRLNSVTNGNNWCPICKNKTEKMFLKWFKNNYDHVINHQAKYDWCKDKRHLPFDFSVESLKLIIEIDGPQHFRQVSNWQSHEITQERDKYKTQMALENGYNIVRILQEDIFKNVTGWEVELVKFLDKV